MEEYRQKLQDPEFHQNLTKAHVYHAADLEHEVKDLDREDHQVPSLTQALLSYLQDANPFNFRPKSSNPPKQSPIQTYNENMIEQNDVFPSSQQQKIDSRIIIGAQTTSRTTTTTTTRPIKIIKIEKPEVVYNPKSTTTVQTTTSTTTTTTTTSTTTYDPIADHVNLLLQQYFSTQTPDQGL